MARKIRPAGGRGKVLSFEQDGEFYYRSGVAKLDKNDLTGAMASYRMALEKEPDNPYAILGIAEILTAMERYDESNRLLMVRLRDREDCPSEAYFGMGCNFMATREYVQARHCFDRYLKMDPGGEFAYDAYDMAEAIDHGEADYIHPMAYDPYRDKAEQGRRKIEQEDYKEAIKLLEEVVEKSPDMMYARNNLALAYYCTRQYDKATEHVGLVLARDPSNLQAHCNLAIFMRGAKDDLGLRRQIEHLKSAKTDNPDDLNHVGTTLMDMGEYEAALTMFRQLVQKRPYDKEALHRQGMCLYYTGDSAAAGRCYEKLMRMDREDSIARYYRGVCRIAESVPGIRRGFPINYQVPADEIIRRIRRLNEYVNMPLDELRRQWKPGGELETMVRWALELPDISVKRVMLSFIGAFRDKHAEYILRDFILRKDQEMELKREAFGLLKGMDATEPYLCYINGEFMKSWVNLMPAMPQHIPAAYRRVLETCLRYMQGIRGEKGISMASMIWKEYVEGLEGFRPLSGAQVTAMAAALEYEACRRCGDEVTKWELCSKYGVTVVRFNNALAKLGKNGGEA